MSWQDQGRQYHMRFGHGTADSKDKLPKAGADPMFDPADIDQRIDAAAHGALMHMPRKDWHRLVLSFDRKRLERLRPTRPRGVRRWPVKGPAAARAVILGAALAVHSGTAFAHARPAASLCHAPEAVLFTCEVEVKTVSICGRQQKQREGEAGAEQAGAVYRYGRQGRVEVEAINLHRAFKGWSGGGETQVHADTPTDRYVVYDRMVRTGFDREGHNLSQMTQGLLVRSGKRTVLNRRCKQPVGAEPPGFDQRRIEALLPEGEYVPHERQQAR